MSNLSDLRELLDHLEAASMLIEGLDPVIPASLYEAEGTAIENLINRFTAVLAEKEKAQMEVLATAAGLALPTIPAEHLNQTEKRCRTIYAYIITYKIAHDGNAPTLRQIAHDCQIPSTSLVSRYLSIIQSEGFIHLKPEASRSIHVTGGVWLPPHH